MALALRLFDDVPGPWLAATAGMDWAGRLVAGSNDPDRRTSAPKLIEEAPYAGGATRAGQEISPQPPQGSTPAETLVGNCTMKEVTHYRRSRPQGECPCCGRQLALTFHHLIPRKLHRRKHFRRHYAKAELARGMYICRDCHDGIHRTYSEMELAQSLATPEALCSDPALARHFAWVARQRRRG